MIVTIFRPHQATRHLIVIIFFFTVHGIITGGKQILRPVNNNLSCLRTYWIYVGVPDVQVSRDNPDFQPFVPANFFSRKHKCPGFFADSHKVKINGREMGVRRREKEKSR